MAGNKHTVALFICVFKKENPFELNRNRLFEQIRNHDARNPKKACSQTHY